MSYRPICDSWILARPKVKYYGAYPNGFLERGRVFMPALRIDPVLHVCGGLAKRYPAWEKLCPYDLTVDLDPATHPDMVADVREVIPSPAAFLAADEERFRPLVGSYEEAQGWPGIIADPPYSEADAAKYAVGADVLPSPTKLLAKCLEAVNPNGGRVGILHYTFVRPPKWMDVKLIAKINITMGYGNRDRVYTVVERRS